MELRVLAVGDVVGEEGVDFPRRFLLQIPADVVLQMGGLPDGAHHQLQLPVPAKHR